MKPPKEQVIDRFLRYVKIDTQSKEDEEKIPSTEKQFNLAKLLAEELKSLRVENVRLTENCYVYGTVSGNLADNTKVSTIGLIAHMDTSPAVSGENVNAIIHKNYQGGDIILPNDTAQIISVKKNPILKSMIGDDIITADGTTLLGSDDKSGVAEIMTLVDILKQNPEIKHGTIQIAFTPDEEVGNGAEKFDIENFNAKFAYTVDGEELGEVSNETWSARTATVSMSGKSTHPGTAKGIMINSSYAMADFLSQFPKDMLPETTEGRVGFIHPYSGKIDVEESSIKVLLRDFDISGLNEKERILNSILEKTRQKFPYVKIKMEVKENYKNMYEVLKNYPELTDNVFEASRRSGITPHLRPIRGGTDGARLTFKGLPCPNIFTGGANFHGKLEFNSRRGLEKTVETLVNLVQIFVEKSEK